MGFLSVCSPKRFFQINGRLAWPTPCGAHHTRWTCLHPLKPRSSGPLEFVDSPLDTGDVAVAIDPEPEHSIEPINDDCSKLSYKSEPLLSEASNASLPSRQRHWMDTRLRTKLRAGGTRQHYQQFDYSTSDTDEETHDEMLPIPTYSPQQIHTQPHPEAITDPSVPDLLSDVSTLSGLPQLFSDHEPMRSLSPHISQSSKTPELSPMGTSAPLLTQPSLTDYLRIYTLGQVTTTSTHRSFYQKGEGETSEKKLISKKPRAKQCPKYQN